MGKSRTSGIYVLTNSVNGKQYVGSAVRIYLRLALHMRRLRNDKHENPHLQNAYNLYGESAFAMTVLEYVDDQNQLLTREQYWIDKLRPEYNICQTAGSRLGLKHAGDFARFGRKNVGRKLTQAHRDAISESLTGRSPTESHRRKLAEANTGKVFSEERRQAISRGRAGIAPEKTQEHLDHIAEALRDKYATDEEFQASVKRAQEASAKARRGKSLTDEHKQRVSEGLKGKKRPPRSPEHIAKLKAAAQARMADPARRAALSQTMKEKGIAPSNEARAKAQATAKRE